MEHKIYFSEGLKFSIGSFELEIPIVNNDGKKCLLPHFWWLICRHFYYNGGI